MNERRRYFSDDDVCHWKNKRITNCFISDDGVERISRDDAGE